MKLSNKELIKQLPYNYMAQKKPLRKTEAVGIINGIQKFLT
jgi:hypothetical protein